MKRIATGGLIAAALTLAACGGGAESTETNNLATGAEENLSFEPANDQSALDMVANDSVSEPLPENMTAPTNVVETEEAPLEGADQVESNVAGM